MAKKILILIVFLCVSYQSFSQTKTFDPKKIVVSWEPIENYPGKNLSTFTIVNKDKNILPNSGWSLYFNFFRLIDPKSVTGNVTIEHLNGDLYKLTPTSMFNELRTAESVKIDFIMNALVLNASDSPGGMYWVWDSENKTGIPLDLKLIPPTESFKQKAGLWTSEDIFNQNNIIENIPVEKLPKILPTPLEYKELEGTFTLLNSTNIIITENEFRFEADYLAKELSVLFGKKPFVTTKNTPKSIVFKKVPLPHEAYQLAVSPTEITISASSGVGIFYGIQSLKSLFPPSSWATRQSSVNIHAVEVKDAPRFGFRSFFLDVARNFQTKSEILRILDLMALYKLNVFHFHLTDDEGWRIEIPALPELTEIGGKRGHTMDSEKYLPPSHNSGAEYKLSGSGFYTKEEFIEILKYATDRHIAVIPEIESPGHARAAIKAMNIRYERLMKSGKPEDAKKYLLADLNDKSDYQSVQNWKDNVICIALPSVYTFVETVIDDLTSKYKEANAPLTTIHFGGDEVPAGVWEKSPAFQQLIKTEPSVKTTDDLWYYYYGKVNQLLKSRGLFLSGWEEIAMRKTLLNGKKHFIPNPDFVNEKFQVNVWNNVPGSGAEDLAYRLANAGYKVVLSCVTNNYFDMAYKKDFDESGYYWGGFVDIDKPFYFTPFNYYKNMKEDNMGNLVDKSIFIGKDFLTDYGKSNIIGLQGLLWTETVKTPERLEYMIVPKLFAISERAWAKDPEWATESDPVKSQQLYSKDWSIFVNKIGKYELPKLTYFAGGYNYRIPTTGAKTENGKVFANLQLPGFSIRYTTDGSEPTNKSKLYSSPISEKGTIKLKVFNSIGRGSRTVTIKN